MGNREVKIFLIFGVLVLGMLGLSQEAFAVTITSTQTGNWQDDSTWAGGVAPTGIDDVVIDNSHVVTISQNIVTSGDITTNFDGTLKIFDGKFLQVSGNTITNIGNIDMDSVSIGTTLKIDGTVTLTGGGTFSMSNSNLNLIRGVGGGLSGDKLVNMNNKIQGSGNLGVNELEIDNQADGVIEANQSTLLLVDPSTDGLTNTGIIRSIGTSTLKLVAAPFTNTNGIINANDNSKLFVDVGAIVREGIVTVNTNAELDLKGTIRDGTLTNTILGTITVSGFGGVIGLVNEGTVNILDGSALLMVGPITNNGNININSSGSTAELRIDGTVTLTGGGTISMSNSDLARIKGNTGGFPVDTLVNVDNKIQGSGNFGVSSLKIDNQAAGIIEANQSTDLLVDTSGLTINTNTGIIRAVGTSTLKLVSGTFTNTNGLIEAKDNSKLFVEVAATVSDGIVNINNSAELDLKGTMQADSLTNSGTLTNSGGTLEINTGDTLTNSGTLNNNSGGTISIEGFLTNNSLLNNNSGATLTNSALLNNNSGGVLTNAGILTNNNSFNNNNGAILTNNNGATLTNNAALNNNSGATLNNAGTLNINTGDTLTNSGTLNNNSGGTITIAGTLANNNLLNNNSGSNLTNNALLNNNSGGILTNTGTLTNNNSFNNNNGATLFNFGTINNVSIINNSGKIVNCGTYTGNLPSGNILLSCIISDNLTLSSDVTIIAGVSVTVDSGAVLTINPGVTLTIPSGENIIIKNGSGVLIKSGGTLQVNS